MADKLQVKIDGGPTAASLLQALGASRGKKPVIIVSRSEYDDLLRRWVEQGTGREAKNPPPTIMGFPYVIDEELDAPGGWTLIPAGPEGSR